MSLLALMFVPLAAVGVRKIGIRVRKIMASEFQGAMQMMESLQETAQGIRIVKAFTLENFMRDRQASAIEGFRKAANKLARVSSRTSPIMESLGGFAIAAVVLYSGFSVIIRGNPPGSLFSFITSVIMLYEPMKRVARLMSICRRSLRRRSALRLPRRTRLRGGPGWTGFDESELIGKDIVSLLEITDKAESDPLQVAREAGETVLRTRAGQTIPVSFVGSTVATDDPQFEGEIFVARDITERKRAERRIRYLARYDALTKIPNRMQFQHLLQQAIARSRRNGRGVAMLYVDMDRFKEVNDTFGHASGDRVLEVLTERLTRVLNSEAVLGRLAGDEFALFVDSVSQDEGEASGQVAQLARTVLHAAGEAFHISQQEVFLTVSIGIALCPRDAENVIDLIRNADAAMYYSKQNGGNTYAFYSPEMNAAAVERLMLKSKLRRAVERDEFVVRYQPKVDLRDGRVVGAEALLRWRLPGHGDIPPTQFIPIAEENNLISAIGEWVLERVCMDFRALRRHVPDPGRISLNLSLKQLKQASFILNCRSVFERHQVPTRNFELEITETTLMADPRRTVQMLNQLHDMGLHLSIDDFGTGYSSLSALQQFPIGTLKIDQSFVRDVADDPADAVLVRTIIDMGHSLGMDVVAEGVESVRQLEFLLQQPLQYGAGAAVRRDPQHR